MSKPKNRLQLMNRLGAKQLNNQWSWCAVDEVNRKVYFSAWLDMKFRENDQLFYILQEPHWGIDLETGRASAARNDQDAKFDLVFNHGYKAFAYLIEAEDVKAIPRSIQNTRTSFVFSLELERLNEGNIIGRWLDRIEVK